MRILRLAHNDGARLESAMNKKRTGFSRIVRGLQGRSVAGEPTLVRWRGPADLGSVLPVRFHLNSPFTSQRLNKTGL